MNLLACLFRSADSPLPGRQRPVRVDALWARVVDGRGARARVPQPGRLCRRRVVRRGPRVPRRAAAVRRQLRVGLWPRPPVRLRRRRGGRRRRGDPRVRAAHQLIVRDARGAGAARDRPRAAPPAGDATQRLRRRRRRPRRRPTHTAGTGSTRVRLRPRGRLQRSQAAVLADLLRRRCSPFAAAARPPTALTHGRYHPWDASPLPSVYSRQLHLNC